MSCEILTGAPVAAALSEKLSTRAAALRARGIVPCLAIVRVGERPDDCSYERGAMKRCASIGIDVRSIVLDADCTQEQLCTQLRKLNDDDSVHGVLLFRPLPRTMNEREVCDTLDPKKDVDGMTIGSMASVYAGVGDGFVPCTAQAVAEMLNYYQIPVEGRRVAVVGRSLVIGRPVSLLLMRQNATVTMCHSRTAALPAVTQEADIVIAAVGHINAIRGEHLRAGQTVIDVGINFNESTQKLCGDVDREEAEGIVDRLSSVPGGVGSVTTSVLASHIIEAAERALGKV